MATKSTAVASEPAPSAKTEPPRSTERAHQDRRVPSARETQATLPEPQSEFAFEPHDTIPAPPWLEELGELEDDSPAPSSVSRRSP